MIKKIILAIAWTLLLATYCTAATQITRNNITLYFGADYTVGQFANGDYYIIDPGSGVIITAFDPASTGASNGAEIDPDPTRVVDHKVQQGFGDNTWEGYSSALNVALNVSAGNPLTVTAGHSLVASAGQAASGGGCSTVANMAAFTVLVSAPAAGSFRPPYVGTDKTIRYNISDINTSVLRSVSGLTGAPDITTVSAQFASGWYDHIEAMQGRCIHPTNQMPEYGADMANQISPALLLLQTDLSTAQKEGLLISLLQYAIDISGAIANGAVYSANGGQGHGRKSVLALGARVFGSTTMLSQLSYANSHAFAEDMHIVGITADYWSTQMCGYTGYLCGTAGNYDSTNHPLGLAEWVHTPGTLNHADSRIEAPYRGYWDSNRGGMLASVMMGLEQAWGRDLTFEYMERQAAWSIGQFSQAGYMSSTWERAMYAAYWSDYRTLCADGACLEGGQPTPTPTPTPGPGAHPHVFGGSIRR